MQEGNTEKNSEIKKARGDYTNFQLIYGAKLFFFTVISISTIIQTRNDFWSLVVGSCTYSIGIVFDFLTSIFINNGPKVKKMKMKKAAFGLTIAVFGGSLILLFTRYIPDDNLKDIISWILRISIFTIGILGPYTELNSNKPNDD